jgi:hypothetical protein
MGPREAPLRPGELRSARFVRSHASRPSAEPRPGVSFISTAEADRDRAARSAPTLPQVPRIERNEAPRAPARRPDTHANPRLQRAPDDARIAPRQTQSARAIRATERAAQPANMRRPDFDARLRARAAPTPQHYQRPPDFRAMRPVPHAAPVQRESAPAVRQAPPSRTQAPAAHPRQDARRRFDPQH